MKAIRAKPTKVNIKSKEGEPEDVLMRLGFGIYVYLNMMRQLIVVFSILTLLAIPSLVFFSQNQAYKEYTVNEEGDQVLAPMGNELYSLGNLGYASV